MSYWDVTGEFAKDSEEFQAKLVKLDGARIATGKDFTDQGEINRKEPCRWCEDSR